MKIFRSGLGLVVVSSFLISSGAIVLADSLSAATKQQLARARNATAKYHDPEQAVADGSGNGLRLVGVEYVLLNICPTEGFSGDDDEWEPEAGLPILRLDAWIWLGNKNGMFAESNPQVP